jgi:ABC-type multidrug transport system fused ATPase/permease subunit
MAFFDGQDLNSMPTKVQDACTTYRKSVGMKMGQGIQYTTMALGGIGVAFFASWQITLVSFSVLPLLAVSGWMLVDSNQNAKTRSAEDYAKAGGVAYTSLVHLRTILSLNSSSRFVRLYESFTESARVTGERRGWYNGFANGSMLGSFLLM